MAILTQALFFFQVEPCSNNKGIFFSFFWVYLKAFVQGHTFPSWMFDECLSAFGVLFPLCVGPHFCEIFFFFFWGVGGSCRKRVRFFWCSIWVNGKCLFSWAENYKFGISLLCRGWEGFWSPTLYMLLPLDWIKQRNDANLSFCQHIL